MPDFCKKTAKKFAVKSSRLQTSHTSPVSARIRNIRPSALSSLQSYLTAAYDESASYAASTYHQQKAHILCRLQTCLGSAPRFSPNLRDTDMPHLSSSRHCIQARTGHIPEYHPGLLRIQQADCIAGKIKKPSFQFKQTFIHSGNIFFASATVF